MPDSTAALKSRSKTFTAMLRGSATLLILAGAGAAQAGHTSFSTIYSLNGTSEGGYPLAPVIVGNDGNVYGTTSSGGTPLTGTANLYGNGTVFSLTPSGQLTTLYTFLPVPYDSPFDGAQPDTRLAQGADGALYGGTKLHFGAACSSCTGVVYKLSGGMESIINTFDSSDFSAYAAGLPSELAIGDDGYLYGEVNLGGPNNCGAIYRMTTSGVVDTSFGFMFGSTLTDGCRPQTGLVKGSDGNFYGMTTAGISVQGSTYPATIFRITPQGDFTALYQYPVNGNSPVGRLVQARNGAFYGLTRYPNGGTIFQITPAGRYSTVYTFSGYYDGFSPYSDLVQGDDGGLYGVTQLGGLFKLTGDGQLITWGSYGFSGSNNSTPPLTPTPDGSGHFYVTMQYGGQYAKGAVALFTPASSNLTASTTLSASSTSVIIGSSTTISWTSTNATSCLGKDAGYLLGGTNWNPNSATSGTYTFSPAKYSASTGTQTFWLECRSSSEPNTWTTRSISITVLPKPPSVTLSVSPASIALSDTATLSWSSVNVMSCTASGAWSGSKAVSGSQTVKPNQVGTRTYKISCLGNDGSTVKSYATLTVDAPPPPTLKFYIVSPTGRLVTTENIALGQSADLEWSAQYASSCEESGAWSGSLGSTGKMTVTPTAAGSYIYTLTCAGLLGGSTTGSVNVVVQ